MEKNSVKQNDAKAWGGRFSEGTDQMVERFTQSIGVDQRLWKYDVMASQAHARMLGRIGVLTPAEAEQLVAGLGKIAGEIEAGVFRFQTQREDIHMNIEATLIERLGALGQKLHTARSRNDQVATDLRLWCRDAIDTVMTRIKTLQAAFVLLAEREHGVVVPFYTHMQRAQPGLFSHMCLAYVEKLERDFLRLADCRRRCNQLPLGSGAVAGTSISIDRDFVAKELGFEGILVNSLDATSDRDFAIEFAFDLALVATHLSGWAEEWIIWNTTEFGFLNLPDRLCTGSSMMPQKKNPDVLELIRGRSARVISTSQQLLILIKGLPLAYNRDLQEDKEALFSSFDCVDAMLQMAELIVDGASLNRERLVQTVESGFLDATALMEYFIKKGHPMREAHEVVGKMVAAAEAEKKSLLDYVSTANSTEVSTSNHELEGLRSVLGTQNAVKSYVSSGSSSLAAVASEIQKWKKRRCARL